MRRGVLLIFVFCFSFPSFLEAQPKENPAEIYFFHALKAKEERRFLRAERLFRKAIEIEPGNPDFHFELGNLYAERNRFEPAQKEYEQAVMISPAHLPARYNLGLIYWELGRMGEAREEFRKVLEINPHHVKAQIQIGYTYQAENFIDEARDAFRKAEEMDFSDPGPKAALEDLTLHENKLREYSKLETRQAMQEQNRRAFDLLYRNQPPDPQALESQTSKQVMARAGAALIQELLTRRRAPSEDDESS